MTKISTLQQRKINIYKSLMTCEQRYGHILYVVYIEKKKLGQECRPMATFFGFLFHLHIVFHGEMVVMPFLWALYLLRPLYSRYSWL